MSPGSQIIIRFNVLYNLKSCHIVKDNIYPIKIYPGNYAGACEIIYIN